MSELLLGGISVALAVIGYGYYIRNTLTGHTRPHALTWLVWSLLNTFVFFEQTISGAGAGAWVTLTAGFANFFIFLLALRFGERTITRFDWVCIALVVGMLLFWTRFQDPAITVLFATTIFVLGLLPTIRKAAKNPHEETATEYAMASIKFFLALFALQTFTFATAFYPLSIAVVNGAFWMYLLIARHRYGPRKPIKKPARKPASRKPRKRV